MAIHNPWLPTRHQDPNARLRLFCLPYAGGSGKIYQHWERFLPGGVQLVALQPPGRANRSGEAPLSNVQAIAESAAAALEPLMDRPWAVFGHSLGAKVGYALTHLLIRRHGVTPRRFFASASRAPHIPLRRPHTYDLPHDAFLAELARLGGTPPQILADNELMEFLAPLLRADFAASETYLDTSAGALPCSVTVLGGAEDDIERGDLIAWRKRFSGDFDLRLFPGGHFFIHEHQSAVLELISRTLKADLGSLGEMIASATSDR
jgi:medium-chain acyl-[acyl-carrier-protein] hydrolase